MFAGVHTAIVTPFKNGAVDEDGLRQLIERQIAGGITGLVPVGTTGESPTLDYDEHKRVIQITVEQANKRCLVIAGTGSNATAEAIELTQAAEKAGADAILQVAPYYNKPSQEGLFQHCKAVADSTKLPIMLYSIPGRCGIEFAVETTARLHAACPTIRAMKEAGGNADRVSQLRRALPEGFDILSGDDSLTLPFMAVGAVGVVSVASNLIPQAMTHMVEAARQGKWEGARRIHEKYYPLFHGFLKLDSNPAPIKAAMHLLGQIEHELRLPMVPMSADKVAELRGILLDLGMLKG